MEIQNPETLEQAREMLLQNHNDMTALRSEAENLRSQSAEKDKQIEELRILNQKMFLRLSQGEEEPEEQDEPEQSLEDFAKTLKGMI